ncbi:hypothetical protein QYF36_014006 [Acer negundo]|nr:hypothetical protein QYF36_014006 [Acer negundo]
MPTPAQHRSTTLTFSTQHRSTLFSQTSINIDFLLPNIDLLNIDQLSSAKEFEMDDEDESTSLSTPYALDLKHILDLPSPVSLLGSVMKSFEDDHLSGLGHLLAAILNEVEILENTWILESFDLEFELLIFVD